MKVRKMISTRSTVLFAVLFFVINSQAFAQEAKPIGDKSNVTKKIDKVKKIEKPESATYFKIELIHGDFDLYGNNYYFNDLGLEIENHWARQHGSLAGFSVGYRKEDFSSASYGHFINGKVFWEVSKNKFYFKPGVGAEWGKPSPRFERTRFNYSGKELISYQRTYLERNAWMPVGVKNTGTFNPFFELSIGQKVGLFLFEGGARIGYDKFITNTFQFRNGDLIFQGLNGEYKFVPTLYIGIGLKMF